MKKIGPCRSAFATATVHPASTVPPADCSPTFSRLIFLLQFLVFLLSTLVVITYLWIVWYFTWFVRLHKPFVYTVKERRIFFAVNKVRVPVLPFFWLFSHFLSLSRLPNTPLRMTTQRMVG